MTTYYFTSSPTPGSLHDSHRPLRCLMAHPYQCQVLLVPGIPSIPNSAERCFLACLWHPKFSPRWRLASVSPFIKSRGSYWSSINGDSTQQRQVAANSNTAADNMTRDGMEYQRNASPTVDSSTLTTMINVFEQCKIPWAIHYYSFSFSNGVPKIKLQ